MIISCLDADKSDYHIGWRVFNCWLSNCDGDGASCGGQKML